MAWPHADTDWAYMLVTVEDCFSRIVAAIARFEPVLLVVPGSAPMRERLATTGADLGRVQFAELPNNDTWARDFGPITVEVDGVPRLLDFGFNGWGLKFRANHDNRITARLQEQGWFGDCDRRTVGLIFEGGSIESDGAGTLLTTSECLLEANRNPHLSQSKIEAQLLELLGAERLLWLDHGALEGDDTDSHIDTLARLAPDDTIVYQGCQDAGDSHYAELQVMARQLAGFRTATGAPYRLIELPWPRARFDEEGQRLPATYANYLVVNGAVLVPTYDDPADASALTAIARAFPDRQIVGVDCSALVEQHGSLHCVTMQLPAGVLTRR
jgi:agmatine deiminase